MKYLWLNKIYLVLYMEPFEIILMLIIFVLIFKSINSPVFNKTLSKPLLHTQDKISVQNEDILIENRGKPIKVMGNFPIPQSTSNKKSLSIDYPEDLSIITQGATIPNNDIIIENRSTNHPLKESHFPEYYRKDTMSGSTIDTTEYKFAEVDNLTSEVAWSDENVSQYPKYYTNKIKNNLTNVGDFFDQNNQYVDTTKPRSTANVDDVCFVSKEGEHVCLDNKHVQNIPPSLISDINNCGFLNSIGQLEYSNNIYESKERVNNGGFLYDKVKGSKEHDETYSEPIPQQNSNCHI